MTYMSPEPLWRLLLLQRRYLVAQARAGGGAARLLPHCREPRIHGVMPQLLRHAANMFDTGFMFYL